MVICGYGRVGRIVGAALERRGFPYVVIDVDPRVCRELRQRGVPAIQGLAENDRNLARAELGRASGRCRDRARLDRSALVVHHVRHEFERLPIIARARTSAEREFLQVEGVGEIVVADTEAALEIARYTLGRVGVSATETQAIINGLRRRAS